MPKRSRIGSRKSSTKRPKAAKRGGAPKKKYRSSPKRKMRVVTRRPRQGHSIRGKQIGTVRKSTSGSAQPSNGINLSSMALDVASKRDKMTYAQQDKRSLAKMKAVVAKVKANKQKVSSLINNTVNFADKIGSYAEASAPGLRKLAAAEGFANVPLNALSGAVSGVAEIHKRGALIMHTLQNYGKKNHGVPEMPKAINSLSIQPQPLRLMNAPMNDIPMTQKVLENNKYRRLN